VATIVVYGQMQVLVAAVDPSKLFEKSFKNSSSFLCCPLTQWKRPVEKLSAPEIHTFLLVPGVVGSRLCLPLRIQQKPTLGFVSILVSHPGKRMPCALAAS
jgi:hypothetical protein